MKRILTTLLLCMAMLSAFCRQADNEEINYVVSYKWGIIHKDAGDAKIIKKPKDNGYELKLIGITKPWADRIYKMRDTLVSIVDKKDYLPKKYVRTAHEKGKYSRDEINFQHLGDVTKGTGIKYRQKKDGTVYQKEIDSEGKSPAYDLLSVFFYLRNLDFESMKPNDVVVTSVLSGDQSEKLTVSCKGKEKVKLQDKTEQDAWHIQFKFTSRGGKKSSDDIDCWISDDDSRIPLLVIASLPVGHIRCTYQP